MSQNYLRIQTEYLEKAWARPSAELEAALPAKLNDDRYQFRPLGEECLLSKDGTTLSGALATGPEGLSIAMYAGSVLNLPVRLQPLKAFKEMPDSMPYHGAFHANAERIFIPHVISLQTLQEEIVSRFSGHINPDAPSGDFSFTLFPLPRIPLYYIFNLPDDEFPASATCQFADNAIDFMPLAGLADLAEYTARRIITVAGVK